MSGKPKDQAPTPTAIEAAEKAIQRVVAECSMQAIKELPELQKAVKLAAGMRDLRMALSDTVIEELFVPLQGTRFGFRTDKDHEKGYPVRVVRECAIEAVLRGFQVIGNEFNIIGGNAYFTKEGFERKVKEFPGVENFDARPGVPTIKDGSALVPYRAKWTRDGQPAEYICGVIRNEKGEVVDDERIPVRVNSGQGPDAVLGKAKRKFLARVYEKLSGESLPDGDIGDTITVHGHEVREGKSAAQQATDDMVAKHKAKAEAAKAAETANADPAVDSSGHPEPGANDR